MCPLLRMSPKLLEGAIIVSDAHFSKDRPELLPFFQAIASKQIVTPQLVLMGDIFDALFGGVSATYKENEEVIVLLQKIASEIEVIYLEGNHDFNLQAVFDNLTLVPIQSQPFTCYFEEKKVLLAHGDFDAPWDYKLYTACIRNRFVLRVLSFLDTVFAHFILRFVHKHLQKKEDCKELAWFESFLHRRFAKKTECDIFIEGHFHQNKQYQLGKTTYINLAAFACNQRYFIVKSPQESEILEEKSYS